jgi:hypothetical protein
MLQDAFDCILNKGLTMDLSFVINSLLLYVLINWFQNFCSFSFHSVLLRGNNFRKDRIHYVMRKWSSLSKLYCRTAMLFQIRHLKTTLVLFSLLLLQALLLNVVDKRSEIAFVASISIIILANARICYQISFETYAYIISQIVNFEYSLWKRSTIKGGVNQTKIES